MENYELNIDTSPQINRINGQFLKGHIPFNKGLPQKDWIDGRKIKRVNKYLEIGRRQGNHDLAGANRIPVVGIKEGKLFAFNSATDAAKILISKGIRINKRNICAVCHQIKTKGYKGYYYIRKKAGGYRWFFADEIEKYKDLLN